jgi:hypothetical protein
MTKKRKTLIVIGTILLAWAIVVIPINPTPPTQTGRRPPPPPGAPPPPSRLRMESDRY